MKRCEETEQLGIRKREREEKSAIKSELGSMCARREERRVSGVQMLLALV